MKKDIWLLIGSILISVLVGLGLLRWLAPQLFGVPTDQQVVKLSKGLPAFYETVFHNEAEKESKEFLINDPVTQVRARPFAMGNGAWGPHDVLGFRNRSVPHVAPVVVIGDSQTYGNNAPIEFNWPNQMRRAADLPATAVYSMATGGWGAVQYLNMFTLAARFQPRVIIVALYTGNDSLESFKSAYAMEQWQFLRLNPNQTLADMPNVPFPAPVSEQWKATYSNGASMIFTPRLRYYSNDLKEPAATTGYAIMAEVARIMDQALPKTGTRLVFTIIPTKELVYAKRVQNEGIEATVAYKDLVAAETRRVADLEAALKPLANSRYISVIEALQDTALKDTTLYSEDKDGHPMPNGYEVIGQELAKSFEDIQKPPKGLVAVSFPDQAYQLYLINGEGVWDVGSEEILDKNGWKPTEVPNVELRDLAWYPWRGPVPAIDIERFGPSNDHNNAN